jgi:hypothetical protein
MPAKRQLGKRLTEFRAGIGGGGVPGIAASLSQKLRQQCRAAALATLPRVREIALDPTTPPSLVLKAFQILCEAGLAQRLEIEDVTPPKRMTYDEIVADLTERLPRVIPLLPLDKQELARLFQERQRMQQVIAARRIAPPDAPS